jgi:hypothetical protein
MPLEGDNAYWRQYYGMVAMAGDEATGPCLVLLGGAGAHRRDVGRGARRRPRVKKSDTAPSFRYNPGRGRITDAGSL